MARQNRNDSVKPHTTLISRLAGTNSLPTLPQISSKLLRICDQSEVDAQELSALVKVDPALALNIMSAAHSVADRSSHGVSNIEQALEIVGSESVDHLVKWSSTLDVFDTFSFCVPNDLIRFWTHSLKCALLAERLAKAVDFHDPDSVYLAGLMHDVGKLVLLASFPNKYQSLFAEMPADEALLVAEEDLVGHNHAVTGASLVYSWPHHSLMADAIRYHHESAENVSHAFPMVRLVYVANLLSRPEGADPSTYEQPAMRLLDLNPVQVNEIVNSADIEFQNISLALGIDHCVGADGIEREPTSYVTAKSVLSQDVRNTSLVAGLLQGLLEAESRAEVMQLVERTLQSHFHINRVLFFLIDRDEKVLEAHGHQFEHDLQLVGPLNIPLSTTGCIPVDTFTRNEVIDSFNACGNTEPTIFDAQIIHLLGKDGMLCLPLSIDKGSVGVIALGLDKVDLSNLSGQNDLLSRVAECAASGFHARTRKQGPAESVISDTLQSTRNMTRKVVHEVSNPLGIISNYLTVLARRLAEHHVEHDEIRIINEEIVRIRDILRLLTDASKEQSVSLAPVDLNALLLDLIRLMKADLSGRPGIQIHSRLNSSIPMALTDKDMLKQAVINLLKNSGEALSEGGNIHVQTQFIANDEAVGASDRTPAGHGGRAQLIIRDDGPGIPEEMRARAFKPFVTSKTGHEGLGLSIVQQLIDQLCGTITCESGETSGTQFTIHLPVANP